MKTESFWIRLNVVTFLWQCFRYYWKARNSTGISYFQVGNHGVPQTVVMIATGRNAWQVSQFAADYFGRQ